MHGSFLNITCLETLFSTKPSNWDVSYWNLSKNIIITVKCKIFWLRNNLQLFAHVWYARWSIEGQELKNSDEEK